MHVVLVEPEIPANTGNIGRLCLATGSTLHLIRPLGFFLSGPKLKRAGLDYWDQVDLRLYDCVDDFLADKDLERIFLVETGGKRLYSQVRYQAQDYLVFGSETRGLPTDLLERLEQNVITLPQLKVRSLNLANTVSVVVYEAWRQLGFFV
ncbi:MAG: tRNA (cytidine(34)-2'-O)-methyltransferase [Firmicutes bacterium]|nr:tRNA (cytidine(34)-2'-O)-methyltransferase [Bacillota bacterium]